LAAVVAVLAGCRADQQTDSGMSMVTEVRRRPWTSPHSTGQLLTTRHYRIHTTTTNPVLLRYLPGFMEASYDNYLRMTGLPDRPPAQPLTIYMMANRRQWVLLTKNVIKRNQEAFLSIEAGGYFYKGACVFWDLGGIATFSVAAHEGCHQFLDNRLRDGLPMWLEEGLCVSAEAHQIEGDRVRFTPDRNPFRASALRSGILNGYWMPIRQLLPLDGADLATRGTDRAVSYYAELWALSMFLRSHPVYSRGLARMIGDAEAGRFHRVLNVPARALAQLRMRGKAYNRTVAEPLFRHYISDDLDAFDRELLAFAKKTAGLE